jgi:NAD(P)H-hydrate epimerase
VKILTAAQMRETDRRTVEWGIPFEVLMENAGTRVVEFMEQRFAPLAAHHVVIVVGKGNNGGDGLVIARLLKVRRVDVIRDPGEITPEMRFATLVVDALLGTGLTGAPREPHAALINEINTGFPSAKVISVDIPSGLVSDSADTTWPHVRADFTVTFTAPKLANILQPAASACGELVIAQIGSAPEMCQSDLNLSQPDKFRHLFAKRNPMAHKGSFGHVLVVGGAPGKTGAANMAGFAALRAGAGLVTICSSEQPRYPELMWQPLDSFDPSKISVLAVGPGLGNSTLAGHVVQSCTQPTVLDADALNSIAGQPLPRGRNLILTPHPGEMSRLTGMTVANIETDRIGTARNFATQNDVVLVLKGRNTLIAFPDGEVFVNTTGNPAMAKAGSGDILTGLIAGLLAQFPQDARSVVPAAVWLHGRCGDLGVADFGEKCLIATDLLNYLPKAMEECAPL